MSVDAGRTGLQAAFRGWADGGRVEGRPVGVDPPGGAGFRPGADSAGGLGVVGGGAAFGDDVVAVHGQAVGCTLVANPGDTLGQEVRCPLARLLARWYDVVREPAVLQSRAAH